MEEYIIRRKAVFFSDRILQNIRNIKLSLTPDSYLWIGYATIQVYLLLFIIKKKQCGMPSHCFFLIRPVYFPIYTYVIGAAPSHLPIHRLPLPDQLIVHIFSIVH